MCISKEKFASIKAELTAEEEALKLQLKMANDRLSELSSTVKQQQQAVNDNKHITRHGEIEKLTPELAKELIKKITIYNNDRINIELRRRPPSSAVLSRAGGGSTP